MNTMYLYGHEVDDDIDFVCIHVEIALFRVTVVCFWNEVAKFIMLEEDVDCLHATQIWIFV